MRKQLLLFLWTSILLAVVCFFWVFFKKLHTTEWNGESKILWAFDDTIINRIDKEYSYSFVNKQDQFNVISIYNRRFIIWEFHDLFPRSLSQIRFINFSEHKPSKNIDYINEVLNSKSNFPTKHRIFHNNPETVTIGIETIDSNNTKFLHGSSFKGVQGEIKSINISNEDDEQFIVFDNKLNEGNFVFLANIIKGKFYLVLIELNEENPNDWYDIFNREFIVN